MTEQRPSYHLFTCPNCEAESRVIWPKPLPSHLHQSSKIKLTCPECKEARELYVFLLDRIMRAPEPGGSTVVPESISAPDPKPDPEAKIQYQQEIFLKRAARFKAKFFWHQRRVQDAVGAYRESASSHIAVLAAKT